MEKVLTVSIAAYNVEKYLAKTLDSFICDKTVMDLFEVIIVNDGSKDDTCKIAKRYTEKYPDTFVLEDKKNGGYGSTINSSLAIARGRYYKLVDGDDWVDTEQFVELVKKLQTETADMVLTKYWQFNETDGSTEVITNAMEYTGIIVSNIDNYTLSDDLAMHQIAYRTALLKKIGMRITEKCFYTDLEYLIKPLPYIQTLTAYDLCVYVYRVGREGQSVQLNSWFKNIEQGITVTLNLAAYYESVKKDITSNKMKRYIKNDVVSSARSKYVIISAMPNDLNPKDKIMAYDRRLKNVSEEIYCQVAKDAGKKSSLLILLLRATGFALFSPVNAIVSRLKKG